MRGEAIYLGTFYSFPWWDPIPLMPMFVSLPLIGFCYSLQRRTVTAAIASTLGAGIVLPWLLLTVIIAAAVWWRGDAVWVLFDFRGPRFPGFNQSLRYDHQYFRLLSVETAVFQAGVAAIALKRSLRLLSTRTFASLRQ